MGVHTKEDEVEGAERSTRKCVSANSSPDHSSESGSTSRYASPAVQSPEHEQQAVIEKRVATRKQISREEYIARLESSLVILNCAKVNKAQLHEAFLHQYLGNYTHRSGSSINPLPCMLIMAQSGSSSALENALTAVSAMTLHRTCKDPRLLYDAALFYSRAIGYARLELDAQPDKASMIATAHFLSIYELLYRASLDETGARAHSFWFLFLTKPNQVTPAHEGMRPLLNSNMRLFAMMETLISRKCPFAVWSLIDKSQRQTCLSDAPATLTNLGLMVANAIEGGDVMCESESVSVSDVTEILNLFEKIVWLQGRLHEFMATYNRQISDIPYRLTAVHASRAKVRGTASIFQHLYEFCDFQTAVLHAGYWMCLLGLAQTLSRVVRFHYCKIDAEIREWICPRMAAEEHANNICMTVPYLGEALQSWGGRLTAARPLNMLYDHYKSTKNWPKLAWCVHCAQDLGSLRVPATITRP